MLQLTWGKAHIIPTQLQRLGRTNKQRLKPTRLWKLSRKPQTQAQRVLPCAVSASAKNANVNRVSLWMNCKCSPTSNKGLPTPILKPPRLLSCPFQLFATRRSPWSASQSGPRRAPSPLPSPPCPPQGAAPRTARPQAAAPPPRSSRHGVPASWQRWAVRARWAR